MFNTATTIGIRWLIFLFLGIVPLWGQSLDSWIVGKDIWQKTPEVFLKENPAFDFKWVSSTKDELQSSKKGLQLFEIPIHNASIRYENGLPKKVVLYIFNRGDMGYLDRKSFEERVSWARDAVSQGIQVPVKELGKDSANAVKIERMEWITQESRFLLGYSFTREIKSRDIPFQAEFIRLEIEPKTKATSLLEEKLAARRSGLSFSGKENVKKQENGDVYIEGIPMVDQGEKGYCVVATAERVLRYYKISVDSHELAQIANSSVIEGTSFKSMEEALKKLSQRLRFRVRNMESLKHQDYQEMIRDYNRLAKRKQAAEIEFPKGSYDANSLFGQMDGELLKEARGQNKADPNKFLRMIQMNVDKGVPVLWTVMLGVIDEKGYGVSGHMRLIFGYNTKTEEIIFSDSWGDKHEFKKMPLRDAWAITTGSGLIEPF